MQFRTKLIKMQTYHPFYSEVNEGGEGKDNPKHWTDD